MVDADPAMEYSDNTQDLVALDKVKTAGEINTGFEEDQKIKKQQVELISYPFRNLKWFSTFV